MNETPLSPSNEILSLSRYVHNRNAQIVTIVRWSVLCALNEWAMFVEHVVNSVLNTSTTTTTNSNTTSNHHSSVCKHLLSITLPIFSLSVSRYLSLRARGSHRINILVALGEFLRRIIAYTSRWASIAYPLHPLTIELDTHTYAHPVAYSQFSECGER